MKPSYRISELERIGDAFRQRAIEAERERDEFRALAEEQSELAGRNAARAQKAEAEIARRDAAALEPVAVVDIQRGRGDGKKFALCYTSAGHSLPDDVYNLYTAAPPAVLSVVTDLAVELLTAALIDGADAKTALKLAAQGMGAQPQKPVSLVGDAVVYEHVKSLAQYGTLPNGAKVTAQFAAGFNYRGEIDKSALDAANVKWVGK